MKPIDKAIIALCAMMLLSTIIASKAMAQCYNLGAKIDSLLPYMAEVESNCQSHIPGDGGRAIGVFQIHEIYVKDYNRIFGANYVHEDVLDYFTAKHITKSILMYYGRKYYLETNCYPTADVLLSIHNGGPRGWEKKNINNYLKKFNQ